MSNKFLNLVLVSALILTLLFFSLFLYMADEINMMNHRLDRIETIMIYGQASPPQGQGTAYKKYVRIRLKVTAYSSDKRQCDKDPYTGAWNNRVKPGMVAVSRDLEKFGITNGTPVIINGKEYTVLDRMHKRKRKHLDIWMPRQEMAEKWGVQYHEVLVPLEHVKVKILVEKYGVEINA